MASRLTLATLLLIILASTSFNVKFGRITRQTCGRTRGSTRGSTRGLTSGHVGGHTGGYRRQQFTLSSSNDDGGGNRGSDNHSSD
eukprot:CAMPEP_0118642510 /NCGR_PEP_ID=MMETSP0785-20121206/5871_1 /TAXON_ID=91992 /ORGANISM="Bolidomonas pacifica, Strain CCMP 1866" /LENGTH=84 /DNA_ID=CAMNT_0006534061 /DNA_START=175 /DNA_END=426 /DNA_ORIENTATION=+